MDKIGPYTNELDHMHETTWINLNHHHMDEIVLLVILMTWMKLGHMVET